MNRKSGFLLLIAAIVLALGVGSKTQTSYSRLCVRCLQRASGVESKVFGIKVYDNRRLIKARGGIMDPDFLGGGVPRVDPEFYKELFAEPCPHVFVLQGKCVSSLGLIKCYGGNTRYRFRTEAFEQLYQVYLRIPNLALARSAYNLIDQLQPIGGQDGTGIELFRLKEYFTLVASEEDWSRLLSIPLASQRELDDFFFNRQRLTALLQSTNASIKLNAYERLSQTSDTEVWKVMGEILDDPQLGHRAADRIMEGRHFPLYGAVLSRVAREVREFSPDTFRAWPYSSSWENLLATMQDDEIRILLGQQNQFVDIFCFGAIAVQQKSCFLDEMVAIANQRPSPQALVAIRELLAGPGLVRWRTRQPQHWSQERWLPSATNVWTWCSAGDEYDHALNDLAKVHLPSEPRPESWNTLRAFFDRCAAIKFSEEKCAAFVEAMSLCDSTRTREWLLNELSTTKESERLACLLGGAGLLAGPELLPILEKLASSRSKPDSSREGAGLDFALHRCRGIHLWRLDKDAQGGYLLVKPQQQRSGQ